MSNQDEIGVPLTELPTNVEGREGFFDMSVDDGSDPTPNKPTDYIPDSDQHSILEEDSSNLSDHNSDHDISFKPMPSIRPDRHCPSNKSRTPNKNTNTIEAPTTTKWIYYIQTKLPNRIIIRRILKCSIAYFISTLFSTIHPLARALGQSPFLVCSGCLFSHPGRTMGAQFDATLTSSLGAAVAIVYGLAGVAAASTYNATHPDSSAGVGINCLFLLLGIFAAQMLRQTFPKLHFFSLQFMVVQLFTLTLGVGYTETPLGLSSRFGLSLLIGNFVSLFVNLIFWPETAVDGLGIKLGQTLSDTKEMLDIITSQFFLDSQTKKVSVKTVENLSEKVRQDMVTVNIAYKEAKYEVSYAYSCSSDLNPIRNTLDRITKHLSILGGSLKNEQGIFRVTQTTTTPSPSSSSSSSDEHSYIELKSKRKKKKRKRPFQSSTTSLPNHHASLTRDTSLRKSALKAAESYANDGTYQRPYPTKLSTSPNSKSVDDIPNNMQAMMAAHHKMNEKSIRFETPSDEFLATAHHNSPSRSVAASEDEADDHQNTRRSIPHSIRSIFSSSNLYSDRHSGREEDLSTDYSNQNTASSFRSFLNLARLSGPKQKPPPRSEKTIGSDQREILATYLEKLRDPLLSLAVECATVLDCVRESLIDQLDLPTKQDTHHTLRTLLDSFFHLLKADKSQIEKSKKKTTENISSLCNCAETMRLQIQAFDKCERNRMHALYKINLSKMHGERLDASIREELFIIFFFIFSLREVAIELEYMAEEMKNLQLKTLTNAKGKKKRLYMPQITTQTWRKWFYSNSYQNVQDKGGYSFGYLQHHMPADAHRVNIEEEYRLRKLASNRSNKENPTGSRLYNPFKKNKKNTVEIRLENKKLAELESGTTSNSIDNNHNDLNEIKPPPILRLRYNIWLGVRYIQTYEFKFALKLSLAVGLLTFPAWVSEYRDWFMNVRGQWAALTVIAVMNPTSGGTLSSGLWRLAGTLIGAFTAWAVLEIDGSSGYLLSGFSFIIAVPFFYIHFSTSYAKVTIVTLISYMIVSLSQYVEPLNSDETVAQMVWLRTLTLIIGLFVALFLNWTVWPFIAREAVRKTLASAISDLGDYYSFVMGTFLYHDEGLFPTDEEFEEAKKIERKLEKKLITCTELLKLTDHEPRLKGPFPKEFYNDILVSSHNLLDRMMSLRLCLMKMSPEVKNTVRKMDKYLYRRDMVASILLHFYTLNASLKAKIPLPSFMPSSRVARKRLLNHRRIEDRPEKLLRYRNLTWFAMACATEDIIEELEHLTDLVRYIVGEAKFTLKARRLENHGKFQKKIIIPSSP